MKASKIRGIAGLVLSLSLLLTACNEAEPTIQVLEVEQSALEEEQVATVERGNLELYNSLEGYVSPKVHQMKFETQGKFGEYQVGIGESVTEGQVLATLNATPYTDKVDELQKELDNLDSDYKYQKAYNEKTMLAYGEQISGYAAKLAVTETEWAEGEKEALSKKKTESEEAKRKLELVNQQLQQTYELNRSYVQTQLNEAKQTAAQITIKAPCDGVVIALQDMNGMEYTNESMYYVAVAENDVYYLQCEYVAANYIKAMQQIVGLRNGKEYELTYVPYEKEVSLEMKNNGETMYTNFEIVNPDEDISYGANAVVKMLTTIKEDVLLIPESTIGFDENGKFVYKKTEDGREKTYITKGSSDGYYTEVKSGLEEGDVVYVQK